MNGLASSIVSAIFTAVATEMLSESFDKILHYIV
jgi:hypothetical protein